MKSDTLYSSLLYLCFWVNLCSYYHSQFYGRLSFQALLAAYSKRSVEEGNKGENTCGDNIITWCLLVDLEVKSIEWD